MLERNSGNSHQRPERNRTQKERHAQHNAQKVDFKLERDIIHIGDGGPMIGMIVGVRLSDGACGMVFLLSPFLFLLFCAHSHLFLFSFFFGEEEGGGRGEKRGEGAFEPNFVPVWGCPRLCLFNIVAGRRPATSIRA